MQVFKLFFRIARSKIGIAALYLIVFTAICFPLVYSSQEQTSFKENSLSLYIRDDDQTEASKSLIEQLAKKNTIVEMSDDRQAILDAMYYGLVDYSLVIQKGYEEMLGDLSGEESDSAMFESYHMHDSYSVAMMDLFFSDYVRNVRMNLAVGKSLPEAIRTTEEEMAKEIPVEIVADPEKAIKDENFTENFAVFFRMMAYVLFAVITNVLCPILLKLNEGDQVEIVADASKDHPEQNIPHATIRWFEYVFTRKATKVLARYLEKHTTTVGMMMRVYDSGKKPFEIETGATILDFAFLRDPEKALRFKCAYVNKGNRPARPDRILAYDDIIRLEYGGEPSASLDWLRIVRTVRARDAVIRYFEGRSSS